MTTELPHALVDLTLADWTAQRHAAALAVARPNDLRIAAAAAEILTASDHAAAFAAWCDQHPVPHAATYPLR